MMMYPSRRTRRMRRNGSNSNNFSSMMLLLAFPLMMLAMTATVAAQDEEYAWYHLPSFSITFESPSVAVAMGIAALDENSSVDDTASEITQSLGVPFKELVEEFLLEGFRVQTVQVETDPDLPEMVRQMAGLFLEAEITYRDATLDSINSNSQDSIARFHEQQMEEQEENSSLVNYMQFYTTFKGAVAYFAPPEEIVLPPENYMSNLLRVMMTNIFKEELTLFEAHLHGSTVPALAQHRGFRVVTDGIVTEVDVPTNALNNNPSGDSVVVYEHEENMNNEPVVVFENEDEDENNAKEQVQEPVVVFENENMNNAPVVVFENEDVDENNAPVVVFENEDENSAKEQVQEPAPADNGIVKSESSDHGSVIAGLTMVCVAVLVAVIILRLRPRWYQANAIRQRMKEDHQGTSGGAFATPEKQSPGRYQDKSVMDVLEASDRYLSQHRPDLFQAMHKAEMQQQGEQENADRSILGTIRFFLFGGVVTNGAHNNNYDDEEAVMKNGDTATIETVPSPVSEVWNRLSSPFKSARFGQNGDGLVCDEDPRNYTFPFSDFPRHDGTPCLIYKGKDGNLSVHGQNETVDFSSPPLSPNSLTDEEFKLQLSLQNRSFGSDELSIGSGSNSSGSGAPKLPIGVDAQGQKLLLQQSPEFTEKLERLVKMRHRRFEKDTMIHKGRQARLRQQEIAAAEEAKAEQERRRSEQQMRELKLRRHEMELDLEEIEGVLSPRALVRRESMRNVNSDKENRSMSTREQFQRQEGQKLLHVQENQNRSDERMSANSGMDLPRNSKRGHRVISSDPDLLAIGQNDDNNIWFVDDSMSAESSRSGGSRRGAGPVDLDELEANCSSPPRKRPSPNSCSDNRVPPLPTTSRNINQITDDFGFNPFDPKEVNKKNNNNKKPRQAVVPKLRKQHSRRRHSHRRSSSHGANAFHDLGSSSHGANAFHDLANAKAASGSGEQQQPMNRKRSGSEDVMTFGIAAAYKDFV